MYIFDDHDEEGQFDSEGLFLILWTGNEGGSHVGSHDL